MLKTFRAFIPFFRNGTMIDPDVPNPEKARQRANDIYLADMQKFTAAMRSGGWSEFMVHRPPLAEKVQLMCFEWEEPRDAWVIKMRPEANVANLWWRPHPTDR